MRLLYVGWLNAGEQGAVGTHTAGVLRAFDETEGVDLTGVFLRGALPPYLPRRYEAFKAASPSSRLGMLWLLVRYVAWVRKKIRQQAPDFVYVRFDPFFAPCIVRPRSIVEYNDIFLDQIDFVCARGGWTPMGRFLRKSWIYRAVVRFSERTTFGKAGFVVAVTEGLAEYCRRVSSTAKTIVVWNASDAGIEAEVFVPRLGSDEDRLVLGHVGTLTHWDGVDVLLEAIALALRIDPAVRIEFRIVGSGAAESDIKAKIAELKLQGIAGISGPVAHDEARRCLLQVDVVPLLKTISGYGLSPIKFYEALALGRTLIVSDIPHINDLPRFCGAVVGFPLRPEEIALQLVDFHRRRAEIRDCRAEIAAYAAVNHSWKARVKDMLGLIRA